MGIKSLLGMIVLLTSLACVPVGQEQTSTVLDIQEVQTTFDERNFMTGLTQYCGDCHGLGRYRFIDEQLTDQQSIEFLMSTKSKLTEKVWAKSIIEVLSWPDDSVPSNQARFDEQRRYMPFGRKKYSFNQARVNKTGLREEMIVFLSRRLDQHNKKTRGGTK
jgi:hypothetical protein